MDVTYILAQLFNGLMLGSFFVLLSLGLSVIFGMMGVINFAHGAFYTLGAYAAYTLCYVLDLGFGWALLIGPLSVGVIGMILERTLIRKLYNVPHVYNLLLTFGLMIVLVEFVRLIFTSVGKPFETPGFFRGSVDLGFIMFPKYRIFIILISSLCATVVAILMSKTRLGAIIRAGTDDSEMVSALGINIPRVFTLVFGLGAALAGLAGVLAAPVQNIVPDMGSEILVLTFVVLIIGGMGSIIGAILGGFIVGELITLGVVFWPPIAYTLLFFFLAVILLARPRGFFGRAKFFE